MKLAEMILGDQQHKLFLDDKFCSKVLSGSRVRDKREIKFIVL